MWPCVLRTKVGNHEGKMQIVGVVISIPCLDFNACNVVYLVHPKLQMQEGEYERFLKGSPAEYGTYKYNSRFGFFEVDRHPVARP